jgi:hypothetical protein
MQSNYELYVFWSGARMWTMTERLLIGIDSSTVSLIVILKMYWKNIGNL